MADPPTRPAGVGLVASDFGPVSVDGEARIRLRTTDFFPRGCQMLARLTFLILFPGLALSLAMAQTSPVAARDPNAVALAGKALQALIGGTPLNDITLQGSAAYTAGSDQEMGPATLVALGNQQSRVTLNLSNGQRQEIRSGMAGVWVGADATPHAMGSHNCLIDAAWFYPGFTLQALVSDPTLAISLLGPEVHAGEAVLHLVLARVLPRKNANAVALVQRISTMHLYLDAASLLPAAFAFNVHPERDTNTDIPFEIRFAGYRTSNGVQVPTRIQRYIQNSLVLDIAVANAAVNSGVPATYFILPSVPAGGGQ